MDKACISALEAAVYMRTERGGELQGHLHGLEQQMQAKEAALALLQTQLQDTSAAQQLLQVVSHPFGGSYLYSLCPMNI